MGVFTLNNMPVFYDYLNLYNAEITPSTVHVRNTGLALYFKRYLMQRAVSVFNWDLPEHWEKNYFLYVLYYWGYVAVINTDKFGVIPQQCGLRGYNVMYQPTHAIISNPLLQGIRTPMIGRDCEVIRLMPDWGGCMDVINFYGDMLALTAETTGVNILNSKLSFAAFAEDKQTAETLKKGYDSFASGEPLTVYAKNLRDASGNLRFEFFNQDVGKNYIADKLLTDMNKILDKFDTEIGIPNANTDKRERLIQIEVASNGLDTQSNASMWLEELKKSAGKVNKMFGLNISVDWREDIARYINEGSGSDED